jgi:hypothetical protein
MSDDTKIMKAGLIVAALIIVIRILLEQAGAPYLVSSISGVVWLYFIMPVLFALAIRNRAAEKPYGRLLKDVVLFAVCTRVMVAITYVAAHYLNWTAARFSATQGGTVGPGIQSWQGLLFIAARNAFIWIVMATIIGMIVGSITLLLKGRKPGH